VGIVKYSTSGATTQRYSVNEDHFANNQWGSLMQTTNQKWATNAIKTSDMALELVESFAITIRHPWCTHRLRVFIDTLPLPHTHDKLRYRWLLLSICKE